MDKESNVGYELTAERAEEYFMRCMEAEKVMGPLSNAERITILKSLGSPVTLDNLVDTMAGQRVLIVKDKK